MKNLLVLAIVLLISACASKYPMKVDLSDYKKGLEITDSDISKKTILGNFCIDFDVNTIEMQPLVEKTDNEVFYYFEKKDLLSIFGVKQACSHEKTIKIINIQSIFHWDGMMRLNIYRVKITLESLHVCNNLVTRFSSTKEKRLKKHGKMIALGLIGEENTRFMIAAVVVLAFDAAITDIYQQIKQQCQ